MSRKIYSDECNVNFNLNEFFKKKHYIARQGNKKILNM